MARNTEVLHKEIDLIQGVISRMANNSFLLKGWVVSLVAVLLALTKDTIVANKLSYFNALLLAPVIVFWYLDAYFLHKEKCYRELYKWVILNRENSSKLLYDLDYTRFKKKVKSVFSLMFNITLWPIYGLICVALVLLSIHNIFFK
jgi:hypothetical protein